MPQLYLKDPDAVLDWKFDWAAQTNGNGSTDWLAAGETITTKSITVSTIENDDAPLVADTSSITDTNTSVTVWLSGGTAGNDYTVACRIETSGGRTDERTITLQVLDR